MPKNNQMKQIARFSALVILSFFFVLPAVAQKNYSWETAKSGGYEYKYVANDPSAARFYTLKNGLTVILSPSSKEPRIQTFVAVKAGSKTDPATNTGLAHYLEHMLFKGTSKFGSLNWASEKPLLDQIEGLYNQYNTTTDEGAREKIYKQIDQVSGEAAHYAIANEYDKMMAAMGSKGSNAFTSFEETVYTEDIPSNAIDRYLAVQAERFKDPVFRLFHTELEAVYEEKNRTLDNDQSKTIEELFRLIFPNNNYGRQTTIGTIHDLKNPSLTEIRKYFNDYYVPNNMGIIMAGDFNPDDVIKKIDAAFSYMQPKVIPPYVFSPEKEIEKPIVAEVVGPQPANVWLGFRFPGASSDDAQILNLVGEMLTNGAAGLIDLDLVKKQKLLSAAAFAYPLKDYSTLLLMGMPTQGQSLYDVRMMLINEIDKLKKGDFSDDLITSIINNEKKSVLEANESYNSRAAALMGSFTDGTDWLKEVGYINRLNRITKQDIIDFANKYLNENYVVIYKRQGTDKSVVKVEKPPITPVVLNREAQSPFLLRVNSMPEKPIQPVWLDYKKAIQKAKSGPYDVLAVKNEDNNIFKMDYHFNTGVWSDKLLPLAATYLEFLGTKDKSADDISKEFYKLASAFNVSVGAEDTYISLEGMQENFDQTVRLFDDLLHHCIADTSALHAYVQRLKKSRKNAKENKGSIMNGLISYARYGSDNPFNNQLSDSELDNLKAEDLIKVLRDLAGYNHEILYYGPESAQQIAGQLQNTHPAPATFTPLPKAVVYTQLSQNENEVLIAHYDMVQAEVNWIRNEGKYDESLLPDVSFFNQYFGGGMESIVFQTIRESKALAYSTNAAFINPANKDQRSSFRAYVGTQSDKFDEAVDAMNDLLNNLPQTDKGVVNARESLLKKMASERVTGQSILSSYVSARKMGRDYDVRRIIYQKIPSLTFKDLNQFHQKEISHKPYTYCIVAGDGKIDMNKVQQLGKPKVLSLEEIFGY